MGKSQIKNRVMEGGSRPATHGQAKGEREEWLETGSSRIKPLPPFEHKEPPDDDTGLPEHPIYSNYSKYLWKGHRRSGGMEIGGPFHEPSVTDN